MTKEKTINIKQKIKDKYIFIYRVLCALLIVLVPVFWIVTNITNPTSQSPPFFREALIIVSIIILVGSFKYKWIKQNMQKVMLILYALVTLWQLIVLNLNNFDTNKCIGFLLVSFAISVGFEYRKYYFAFISFFLISVVIVISLNDNVQVSKPVFLLTLFSIQLISFFLNSSKISTERSIVETNAKLIVKNRETLDSIKYAQRIQNAILPSHDELIKKLPNSFIFYKPKAIVSGDFYWLQKIDGIQIFAVADCTGHGVPGAMVSVICNNALNRAVREFYLLEPARILNKVRELIIEEFAKSDEDVTDGMDITLCSIDDYDLQYAGAHNPLWICRNNEIIEYKADKQPIGNFVNAKPFTNHKIKLQKNDVLYLSTDGFADQFGGEAGKKLKRKNLKKYLIEIASKSPKEKEQLLRNKFNNWKSYFEQVDDVCVMGVCIK